MRRTIQSHGLAMTLENIVNNVRFINNGNINIIDFILRLRVLSRNKTKIAFRLSKKGSSHVMSMA